MTDNISIVDPDCPITDVELYDVENEKQVHAKNYDRNNQIVLWKNSLDIPSSKLGFDASRPLPGKEYILKFISQRQEIEMRILPKVCGYEVMTPTYDVARWIF